MLLVDKKLTKLLSDVFLDLSKAWIIGTSVAPVLSNQPLSLSALIIGIIGAILSLLIARVLMGK